jgi:crotonobetainyl-CoA:carnitine CoA-transferase CaiB-like acyl-CoA transferase
MSALAVAGEYCGKLPADFGAEVIMVEAPGRGSRTRVMTPGAVFAYLNTNKLSVVLDDIERLHQLIGTADVVVDDRATDGTDRYPGAVFCSISPFGAGVGAEFDNAKSINVFHASGWG